MQKKRRECGASTAIDFVKELKDISSVVHLRQYCAPPPVILSVDIFIEKCHCYYLELLDDLLIYYYSMQIKLKKQVNI